MGRYLIVTWDGAGNLVPTLGIARTLVERGHDVRMIGHDTIAERCGDVGARFVPLTQGQGWDAMEDPDDFEAEVRLLIEELCFSATIARDVALELDRESADAERRQPAAAHGDESSEGLSCYVLALPPGVSSTGAAGRR